MKKLKLLFVGSLLATFTLVSCYNESQEAVKIGNFTNELLFEKDGCKMYRFMDANHAVYWSTCDGKVQYTTSGKHPENITSTTN